MLEEQKVRDASNADKMAVKPLTALDDIVAYRVRELTGYQSARYAAGYEARVQNIAQLARDKVGERAEDIAIAAAKTLYKVMAYKDEYEVARLYSNGEFQRKLEARFEGDYELRFNLAPPLLSRRDPESGELIKREFGPWVQTAFSWLARARFLRGTVLDIFGYTDERKQERQDIADYRELLSEIVSRLNDDNYATAAELAGAWYKLRGYGHVKDRNRGQLRAEQAQLLARLRGEVSEESTVRFINAA